MQAVLLFQLLADSLLQLLNAGTIGIAGLALVQRLLAGIDDILGRVKIGLAQSQGGDGDALRRQLKQYIDDAAQAKNEVSELKRELFKLQNKK